MAGSKPVAGDPFEHYLRREGEVRDQFLRFVERREYILSGLQAVVEGKGMEVVKGGAVREVCAANLPAPHAILGQNYFGLEDWAAFYEAHIPEEQVPVFPWPDEVLEGPCPFHRRKKVRDTHFAVLGVETVLEDELQKPLTIMEWRELHPRTSQPRFYSDEPWYKAEQFATQATCQLRWYLLLKEIVPNSESKTWDEQLGLLPEEYEVPTPVEEITKNILCYRKSKKYVNRERYARCNACSSDGYRVVVGRFVPVGLRVDGYWCVGRRDVLGVAASRKLPA